MTTDAFATAVEHLADVLSPISAYYAFRLMVEREQYEAAKGLKSYVTDRYVVSQNKGGRLIYLYGKNTGLKHRVATVYEQTTAGFSWVDLPFRPSEKAKVYTGEAAPSRDYAEEHGFMNEIGAFRIVLEPHGETADGKTTYRPIAYQAIDEKTAEAEEADPFEEAMKADGPGETPPAEKNEKSASAADKRQIRALVQAKMAGKSQDEYATALRNACWEVGNKSGDVENLTESQAQAMIKLLRPAETKRK